MMTAGVAEKGVGFGTHLGKTG